MVSEYFFSIARTPCKGIKQVARTTDFKGFVQWRIGEKGANGTVMHYLHNGNDLDNDFDVSYDDYIKMENIQEDFNRICNKLEIESVPLKKRNSTKHKHYVEYYDKETIDLVAEVYAKDIAMFDYKFGE